MIREDGWQELRLVFPNEDADDVCREFQEQGVEILRAQGVMKLQKSWHKKAAWAGGVVGGFWILNSGRKGLSAFLAGRQALADFGRLRSIAALGGASLAAGAATLAVQWGLAACLCFCKLCEASSWLAFSPGPKHERDRLAQIHIIGHCFVALLLDTSAACRARPPPLPPPGSLPQVLNGSGAVGL